MATHPNQNLKTIYDLDGAIRVLPGDISKADFLTLLNHCLPRARVLTVEQIERVIRLTRNFQGLPADYQLRLLSPKPKSGTVLAKARKVIAVEDRELFIKEQASELSSWIRDLHKLGVNSAASYIFPGRRTAQRPPQDWANDVLYFHFCEELTLQDGVVRSLEGMDNAFILMPDRKWHIRFHGEALPPIPDKFGGLSSIHSLIEKSHVSEIELRDEGKGPYCFTMPAGSALSAKRQRDTISRVLETSGLKSRGTVHSFDVLRGDKQQEGQEARIVPGRSNPEDKQIMRAIREVSAHNSRAGAYLNNAIEADDNGLLCFKNRANLNWITQVPSVSVDAKLERTPRGWRIQTPLSDEIIEIPGNKQIGMTYIARVLQQAGVSVPCGLLANVHLLEQLTDRPPYQKLFKRTFQKLVRLDEKVEFDLGTRLIIDAVNAFRGYPSKYYEITHAITRESPLAKYITTGFVSLTASGLGGVLYLLKKRLAAETLDGNKPPELMALVNHMDKAVTYVTRYEQLAAEIEPESNMARDKVQKAIRAAIDHLWQIGESSVGKYFETHIKTGKLCSHNGPWLWEVKGLPEFPDVLELAKDHIYMKLRRMARKEAGISEKGRQRARSVIQ